jgi:uncharacterized protein (TIGR02001 family)
MQKQSIVAAAVAMALVAGASGAAEEPKSPHTITGNVGLFSQYIFRGLTQTDRDPAIQGGLDYSHESGFYLGTWASNISWLRDFELYKNGGSMEWDFYGGFKSTFGKSDFGYDVGLLYYWYPGDAVSGGIKANTFEAYGALTWKFLSAKYSYSLDDKTFGVRDSDGTWYLDFSADYPVTDKFNIQAHWGKQKFKGNSNGQSNDSNASYEDWKIGASYLLPKDFKIGVFYTDTSMSNRQKNFYTALPQHGGRFIGDNTVTVFLQKTF